MASRKLEVLITGKADKAIKALRSTESAAGGLAGKIGKVSKVVAASFLGAGVAAGAMAVKSAHTFETVGSEVMLLQKRTGLGVEAASKLRYEFQQSGIDAKTGAAGLAILSKKVVSSKDGMKDFGFAVRDSHGKLLPMNTILAKAADKLHGMKDGFEKNALAQKMFGKGGLVMAKLFGKGSDAMSKLGAEAKKYGLVLTEDNVKAVGESIKAHRQQKAAMEGLQVTIGQYVLPILTKLTTFFATKLPIAIEWMRKAIDHNKAGLRKFGAAVGKVGESIKRTATTIMNKMRPALKSVQEFLAKHPAGALKAFAAVIGGVLVVAFVAWAVSAASAAAATFLAAAPIILVVAALGLLAYGIYYAYTHFKTFHNVVDSVGRFLRDKAWPAIQVVATGIASAFGVMARFVGKHWKAILAVIVAVMAPIIAVIAIGVSLIHDGWKKTWERIKGVLDKVWPAISAAVLIGISKVADLIRAIKDKAPGWLGNVGSKLLQKGRDLVTGLLDGIRARLPDIGTVAGRIPGLAWNAIGATNTWLFQKGRDLITGFLDGMRSRAGDIASVVQTLTNPATIITGLFGRKSSPGVKVQASPGSRSYTGYKAAGRIGSGAFGYKQAATGASDIHIHVAGSVVTEKQLVDVIRDAAITRQRITGRPFIPAV